MDYNLIKELESKHSLKGASKRPIFTFGQGNKLFDVNSHEYTDFAGGGENCLGYGNPMLTEALVEQANRLVNSPFTHDRYALALSGLTNGDSCFQKAAITSDANDANALAVEIAKNYFAENGAKREKIVFVAGESLNKLPLLKSELDGNTAAVIVEPVTDGVVFADYDYLVNAYALAKSMDILFVCDETRIGQGRFGKRFVYEIYGIQPDIVTISAGMGGGICAGAVLVKSALKYKSEHNELETASALACSAVSVVNDFLSSARLNDIAETGDYLMSRLVKLNKHNFVLNIRGKGLLAAIELSGRITGAKIVSQMEKSGYLIGLTGGNTLKLCPPLTVTREEINGMADALSEIFAATNI